MGLTEEKYKASNQIIATYFCFLVTPATRKFMKEWLSLCCDFELLSPAGLGKFDVPTTDFGEAFVAHREIKAFFHYYAKNMEYPPIETSANVESTPKPINHHSMPIKFQYTQMISINL